MDFESYFMQRLNEFFGPDFGPFLFGSVIRPEITSTTKQALPGRSRRQLRRTPWPLEAGVLPKEEEEEEAGPEGAPVVRRSSSVYSPHINLDICEMESGYLVEANLPGVPKDNIEVTVDNNHVLNIKAHPVECISHSCGLPSTKATGKSELEAHHTSTVKSPSSIPSMPTPQESPKKETKEFQSPRRWLLSERPKEELHRSVRLPKDADPSNVKSCVENGVLCLTFSKLPTEQVHHKIEVH